MRSGFTLFILGCAAGIAIGAYLTETTTFTLLSEAEQRAIEQSPQTVGIPFAIPSSADALNAMIQHFEWPMETPTADMSLRLFDCVVDSGNVSCSADLVAPWLQEQLWLRATFIETDNGWAVGTISTRGR